MNPIINRKQDIFCIKTLPLTLPPTAYPAPGMSCC